MNQALGLDSSAIHLSSYWPWPSNGVMRVSDTRRFSGSGSAVFGLYETETAAKAAEERLSAKGIASMRTKTLPREAYWRTMIVGSEQ